jgi:predicted nucleotidyltransferase
MDLSSPLRTIAPGLGSAVLQVLAGTQSGLSASQIAHLSDRGTRVGQLPVLTRLVEHGLVIADPANRGFLYRLNRSHVLAEAILSAARARAVILDRLTEAAQVLRPAPVSVSAFGSFARGEAGPDSDLDMLIVTATDAELGDDWEQQLQKLEDQVLSWTGNRLERLVLSVDRLRAAFDRGEPVIVSWHSEAITLTGMTSAELLSREVPAGTGRAKR